jgi:hypothetical protein
MAAPRAAKFNKTAATKPSLIIWELDILVPLLIIMIFVVGFLVLNLESRGSEDPQKNNVAFDTYTKFSQELDSISEKYSKKLGAHKQGS